MIQSLGEDLFCISVDTTLSLRGIAAGEGPLTVGVAHGDLSIAEIVEALDANLTSPDDIIARERSRRPVRRIGIFAAQETGESQILNGGIVLRTKLRFSVGNGHDVSFWIRNQSGAALTTGGFLETHGTLFGRWQR